MRHVGCQRYVVMSRTLLRERTFDSGLFRRVHKLKALIGGRLVAMRTGCGRTALGNLRSVRPKGIVKKSVGLRFNLTMAECSIAVRAIQSPVRHRNFLAMAGSPPSIMPKLSTQECSRSNIAVHFAFRRIIDRVATITYDLLLELSVYFVNDGNDIRQQFNEVQLSCALVQSGKETYL